MTKMSYKNQEINLKLCYNPILGQEQAGFPQGVKMNETAIQVENACKNYGDFCAVDRLSFSVPRGICYGLLGPNGAGKTTMMKMLYAKATLTDGKIDVFGFSPKTDELSIKSQTGIVPQDDNLDEDLNIIQNLRVFSKLCGLKKSVYEERIEELLQFMELTEKKKSEVKELSGGMKRRLSIARALLNEPELLILDEPTTGLDPQVRHLIWNKLRELKKQGTTILLTTHYMEEAFQICDELMIMDKGNKLVEGSPNDLLTKHIEPYVLEIFDAGISSQLKEEIEGKDGFRMDQSHEILLIYGNDSDALQKLAQDIAAGKSYFRQSNLEDLFLKITGRELNELQ